MKVPMQVPIQGKLQGKFHGTSEGNQEVAREKFCSELQGETTERSTHGSSERIFEGTNLCTSAREAVRAHVHHRATVQFSP